MGEKNFILLYNVHNQLRKNYGDMLVLPSVQSPSTEVLLYFNKRRGMIKLTFCYIQCILFVVYLQNLTIERIWVEVNSRINYPLSNSPYLIHLREMKFYQILMPYLAILFVVMVHYPHLNYQVTFKF